MAYFGVIRGSRGRRVVVVVVMSIVVVGVVGGVRLGVYWR